MAVPNPQRLAFAGPVDPVHGFPMWFEDASGLRLELVLDPDPFAPAIGELPDPAQPLQFPDNFPDEAFYFMAEARLPVGGAGVVGRARVILALEAAFGGAGAPAAGMAVVFARIRFRIDDVVPGATYTVTHPYGVTDPLPADDRGRVFVTEDLGIVEGDPTAVLNSGQVAPFLRWNSGAAAGYIGDGATDHQITGSPFNTNFVRIEGPNIRQGGGTPDPAAPADINRVWTDLFTVQGRVARRVGASADAATYAVSGAQRRVSIQARSVPAQSLELVGDGLRVALAGNGRFYSGLGEAAAVPADLRLVNVTDSPVTSVPLAPTDLVIVEKASHDLAAQTLTISARSSDPAAALSVPSLGLAITSAPQTFSGIAATPAELVVISDKGGAGRQRVELTGAAGGNLGVAAHVVTPVAGRIGQTITLDGSGSSGATAFAWAQTSGPAVALTGATSAIASFVPAAAGAMSFTLTVQGAGGPQTATADVTISAAAPADQLTVTEAQYRTNSRQYRFSGTVNNLPNTIVVTFGGTELGRATPDATGAWSVRRTLLPAEGALVPSGGNAVSFASSSAVVDAVIRIRN